MGDVEVLDPEEESDPATGLFTHRDPALGGVGPHEDEAGLGTAWPHHEEASRVITITTDHVLDHLHLAALDEEGKSRVVVGNEEGDVLEDHEELARTATTHATR